MEKVRLADAVTFTGGGTPRKDVAEYWSDDIPWATVKDFKSLTLSRTADAISKKGLESSSSKLIPAGHVIIPTRMALGKAAINTVDVAINQDLRALIPKRPLDATYLLHSLLCLAHTIQRNGSGATVKGITQKKLGDLEISLPPLAEQKRIARILDAADALRTKRRESLAQLDALLQSTFLTLFGDPVTNPMGWKSQTFGDVVGNSFRNGLSPSRKGYFEGQVLTLSAVTAGTFDFTAKKAAYFGQKPSARQYLTCDTFLICRGNGNKKLVGLGAFSDRESDQVIFPDTMIGTTVDLDFVAPSYLQYVWRSKLVRRQIEKGARTTNGTHKVNQKLLTSILLPIPPLDLQRRFAAIVESIEQQKTRLRAHLSELDALFASLQSRAFNGTL